MFMTLVLAWPQACCVTSDVVPPLGLGFPIYSEGLYRGSPDIALPGGLLPSACSQTLGRHRMPGRKGSGSLYRGETEPEKGGLLHHPTLLLGGF